MCSTIRLFGYVKHIRNACFNLRKSQKMTKDDRNLGCVMLCRKMLRDCAFKEIWQERANQKSRGGGKRAGG